MKRFITYLVWQIAIAPLFHFYVNAGNPKIDPVKFTLTSNATNVHLNEEFEIKITAEYLNLSPNVVFVLKDANNFRLKLTLPDGFVKTGGDYYDYIGAELDRSHPRVTYTLRGKFTTSGGNSSFELLRSHKNADAQSTYVAVGKLSFVMQDGIEQQTNTENLRTLASTDFVPYMTLAQLRSGLAGTAKSVSITDQAQSGIYLFDSTDTNSQDDTVFVVKLASGTKRYKRQFDGNANIKWWDVTGDSTVDVTAKLQRAINHPKVRSIYFPAGVFSIGTLIITSSNKELVFEPGARVEGRGSQGQYDYLITLRYAKNITIRGNGLQIRDSKAAYPVNQDRGGVRIMSSENITINDVKILNSPGDGFYIGSQDYNKPNKNIVFNNCHVDGVNRNGWGIINVIGLEMNNCTAKNIDGAAPEDGIYFEPNNSAEVLSRIRINGLYTEGNGGAAIGFSPTHLVGTGKVVDVIINNHHDVGSAYGCIVGASSGDLAGHFILNNPIWENNYNNSFMSKDYAWNSPRVEINSPVVINPGTHGYFVAAFATLRLVGGPSTYFIGNTHIKNAVIKNPSGTYSGYAFFFNDILNGTNPVKNCSIVNTMEISGVDPVTYIYQLESSLLVEDTFETLTRKATANTTLSAYSANPKLTNEGATDSVVVNLDNFFKADVPKRVEFEVKENQLLRIVPLSATVAGMTTVNGSPIESRVVGSRIILEKHETNSWSPTLVVGSWQATDSQNLNPLALSTSVYDSNRDFSTEQPNRPKQCFYAPTTNRTVILPPPAKAKGVPYTIKKISNNAYTVTVSASGGALIENASNKVISAFLESHTFVSDGSKYWIVD